MAKPDDTSDVRHSDAAKSNAARALLRCVVENVVKALSSLRAAEADLGRLGAAAQPHVARVTAATQAAESALVGLQQGADVDFSWDWTDQDLQDLTAYSISIPEERGWLTDPDAKSSSDDASG